MVSKNNKIVVAKTIQRREFDYQIGHVRLNFTLRTDEKSELKMFKELAERAIKDIDAELEALK